MIEFDLDESQYIPVWSRTGWDWKPYRGGLLGWDPETGQLCFHPLSVYLICPLRRTCSILLSALETYCYPKFWARVFSWWKKLYLLTTETGIISWFSMDHTTHLLDWVLLQTNSWKNISGPWRRCSNSRFGASISAPSGCHLLIWNCCLDGLPDMSKGLIIQMAGRLQGYIEVYLRVALFHANGCFFRSPHQDFRRTIKCSDETYLLTHSSFLDPKESYCYHIYLSTTQISRKMHPTDRYGAINLSWKAHTVWIST